MSLIILDSVLRVNKIYYPETFLEKWKREIRKTKMKNLINDELEPSSSDSETESDNESDDESKDASDE